MMIAQEIQRANVWPVWRGAMRIVYLEGRRRRPLRASCGWCWGQGAIWEPLEGGGHLAVVCPACGNAR